MPALGQTVCPMGSGYRRMADWLITTRSDALVHLPDPDDCRPAQ